MRKKYWILITIGIVFILSLIPHYVVLKDGGTKTFTSLLYKVIVWNHIYKSKTQQFNRYHKTELYIFPNNFHSMQYYYSNIERQIKNQTASD